MVNKSMDFQALSSHEHLLMNDTISEQVYAVFQAIFCSIKSYYLSKNYQNLQKSMDFQAISADDHFLINYTICKIEKCQNGT